MDSIDEVFKFIMKNERTIVYGNLGRKYYIIYDYIIRNYPTFEIIIDSKYYNLFSKEHIHVNSQVSTKCDLFIYIEPEPVSLIIQPELASRVVVFTSHLCSKFLNYSYWAFASYIHLNNSIDDEIQKTKKLISLQQPSRYFNKIDKLFKYRLDFDEIRLVSVNTSANASTNDIVLIPGNIYPSLEKKTVIIADLTHSISAGAIYIYLLDIIDFLKENINMIEYWFICFPVTHNVEYINVINTTINKLFCRDFKYSNISLPQTILIYPFYKTGTVNRCEPCETKRFCNLNYVAPMNYCEAYSVAIVHNLEPLTNSIYFVT